MAKQKLTLEQQAQEICKCRDDLVYFVENYCYVDLGAGHQRIPLTDKQREMLRTFVRDHNVLVLGSRQTGKTTLMVCYCAWAMLFFPTISITFISRKEEQAKRQLVDIEIIFEHLPDFMRPTLKPNQATNKTVKETGSEIKIESVLTNPEGKGRGIRSHIVWVDEAAFLKTLKPLMVGLIPTTAQRFQMAKKFNLPYGIVMTTTPNGVAGYGKIFYDMWCNAEKDKTAGTKQSYYTAFDIHWRDMGIYDESWYEQQKQAFEGTSREFHQEFDMVFLGGRESLLLDETIKALTAEPPIEKEGCLWIWERAMMDEHYIISADVATVFGEAYSTIQVIKASNGQQVAEFRDKLNITHPDPNEVTLATMLKRVAELYPNSIVSFENNGVGNELQAYLPYDPFLAARLYKETQNSKKYGVNLTKDKRQLLFRKVYAEITPDPGLVRSSRAIAELVALCADKNNRITKPASQTDDLALALGHAYLIRANHFASPVMQAKVSPETDKGLQTILRMNLQNNNTQQVQSKLLDPRYLAELARRIRPQ